jgi:hypothetical protein
MSMNTVDNDNVCANASVEVPTLSDGAQSGASEASFDWRVGKGCSPDSSKVI